MEEYWVYYYTVTSQTIAVMIWRNSEHSAMFEWIRTRSCYGQVQQILSVYLDTTAHVFTLRYKEGPQMKGNSGIKPTNE
jgi:hypothetical protein